MRRQCLFAFAKNTLAGVVEGACRCLSDPANPSTAAPDFERSVLERWVVIIFWFADACVFCFFVWAHKTPHDLCFPQGTIPNTTTTTTTTTTLPPKGALEG
eukprot:TRINITY_DN28686_c1_g1_i2.p3 TRINITY_DN28686_c1_g1~~TRINITY_DN28686_c1_g1_i2.p3  ORF type:complete len:101 (-),score=1.44 TRINITY_DN28686_c1_g1_i2:21-323(-)